MGINTKSINSRGRAMSNTLESGFLLVLGIDPGSRVTGYGVIKTDGQSVFYVDSGCIRVKAENLTEKIYEIYSGVSSLMQQYQPQTGAIEQVFLGKNVSSALKLGQARGAALAAIANHHISIAEYAPRTIKQAVVGSGAAEKNQVNHMVRYLLQLNSRPQTDAADALAIALCHAFHLKSLVIPADAGIHP